MMGISAEAVRTLRDMAGGDRFFLRGDRAHGFRVSYEPSSLKRRDKTCRSLPLMARAGWIEFASEPLDLQRYYRVRLTSGGATILKGCGRDESR